MKKVKKVKLTEKYKGKHIWGWADSRTYMGEEKAQVQALLDAGCDPVYSPSDGNTIKDALAHARDGTEGDIMVVVGLRVLKNKHTTCMESLSATKDKLFSLASNKLYDCRNAETYASADAEVLAQRMAPMSNSENPSGPKHKLVGKLLKAAQTMKDSKKPLKKISIAMLEQHDLEVSPSTLSRRLK